METIIVPEGAVLKNINILECPALRKIEFPTGKIEIHENETFGKIHINENAYIVRLVQSSEQKYRILDKDTFEILREGQTNMASNGYLFKDSVFVYDSIYDVDTTQFDEENDIFFYFGNVDDEYWFNNGSGKFEGQIYKLEEVKEIQEVILGIIEKVNVPPETIANREKIIYAQIIKNIHEHLALNYDYDVCQLIENRKKDDSLYSCETMHEKEACDIDSSQNLKGLLKGSTVCAGFSTIVETISQYFGIDCKKIQNEDHAWNYVKLDGKYYEDDFTWYKDKLQVADIKGIDMFLRGMDKEGKRIFSSVEYHQLQDDSLELGDDITGEEKFNLLSTNWSTVKDWESIDITAPTFSKLVEGFPEELKEMAESKKTTCLIALNKLKNTFIFSAKNFVNKVHDFIFGEKDR